MPCLLERYAPGKLLFVDGWIGKGAILKELKKSVAAFPGVSADIAVLADPANVTRLCGTHEDILIPSACLNCTVSGLISRTFLRDDIIGASDFHGAVYYGELKENDLSYPFIHAIEKHFTAQNTQAPSTACADGWKEVMGIASTFGISNIHLIKPGIGETTRVLLRRVPWRILVNETEKGSPALRHIFKLAEEKQVPVQYYPMQNYKCCGLIKQMADT